MIGGDTRISSAIVLRDGGDLLGRDLSPVPAPYSSALIDSSDIEQNEVDLHILIPVPSHNIPNTPPPAALNGSPNELWEGEMIPHPVPPRFSRHINEVEEGGKGSG